MGLDGCLMESDAMPLAFGKLDVFCLAGNVVTATLYENDQSRK